MDTSLLQGLALLETRDGEKSIKGPKGEDSYNLFNIKDNSGQGFRAFDKAEGSRDAYRTYSSREDSIKDLISLLQRKYPDAHAALLTGDAPAFATALKAGGYATDPKYVEKLTGAITRARKPAGMDNAGRAVQDSVLKGGNAVDQLMSLRQNGWGADIDEALKYGWKPEEIVKRLAGSEVSEATAAKAKQDSTGAFTRFGQGASNAVSDAGLAVKQIFSSGDQEQVLREEAARRRDDIDRRALDATTAGKVGAFAPATALQAGAAVATGGMSIPAQIAAGAGTAALTGALKPTTEDGERTSNILTDAALGGAGGGVGALGGKALSAGMKAVGPDAAAIARINAAKAAGLTPQASDASPMLSGLRSVLKDNPTVAAADAARSATVHGGADATVDAARKDAVAALLKNAGQTGDTISSDTLAGAGDRIYQPFNDALKGRVVSGMSQQEALATKQSADGLLSDYQRLSSAHDINPQLVDRGAALGRPSEVLNKMMNNASGDELMASRQSLVSVIRSASASQADKTYAQSMLKLLDAHIAKQAPELAQTLATANEQYSNLVPLKKLVRSTGDTGEFTTKQLARAIANNGKGSFVSGDAPQQAVLEALRAAEAKAGASRAAGEAVLSGQSGLKGKVGEGIGHLLNAGDASTIAAIHPSSIPALLGRYLLRNQAAKLSMSDNPALLNVLSGNTKVQKLLADPAVRSYVAKAVGGLSGGVAGAAEQ